MSLLRTLWLVACLFAGIVQASELKVAIGVQDPAQLAMGGNVIPPNMPGSELIAVNDDLAREICRRLHARCTVSFVPFSAVLPGVEDGRFDLGFGNLLRTPERDKRVAFSTPIWRSSSRLVGTPATAEAFAVKLSQAVSVDNLRDARVAALEGSQQLAFLNTIANQRSLTVSSRKTAQEVIEALRDNSADFGLLSVLSAYALLNRDTTRQIEFIGSAVADRGLGGTVHIALPLHNDTLRQSVDQAIAAIRADGSFQRIARRHFPLGLD
jgi:ABC-type amino acid transport substrate-binding protein